MPFLAAQSHDALRSRRASARRYARAEARALRTILIAAAVLVSTFALRASASASAGAPEGAPHVASQTAPTATEVAALYKLHCQMCHGANGKAPLPEMAFAERDWKHGTSSAQMAKVIVEGVKGTPMMPFKGKLKPEQILALAKLVRTFDPRLKPEKP